MFKGNFNKNSNLKLSYIQYGNIKLAKENFIRLDVDLKYNMSLEGDTIVLPFDDFHRLSFSDESFKFGIIKNVYSKINYDR